MPSSSDRSTAIEWALYSNYRLAFARLNCDYTTCKQANAVTHHFAQALDTEAKDLIDRLKFDKRFHVVDDENGRIRKSDRIYHAGNAFADAASCLEKKGRLEEAGEFREWAHDIVSILVGEGILGSLLTSFI